jgi:hypothetical protein
MLGVPNAFQPGQTCNDNNVLLNLLHCPVSCKWPWFCYYLLRAVKVGTL